MHADQEGISTTLCSRERSLLMVAGFAAVPSFAQGGKGAISGRVVVASGAVLQGARVEILQRLTYLFRTVRESSLSPT
jgi:hypothetical protein